MNSIPCASEEKAVMNESIAENSNNHRNSGSNSIINSKEENKGGDKPAKVHVHVPPRIDDEWYQVDAPEPSMARPPTEYSDWLGSHSALCSYNCAESPEVLGKIYHETSYF